MSIEQRENIGERMKESNGTKSGKEIEKDTSASSPSGSVTLCPQYSPLQKHNLCVFLHYPVMHDRHYGSISLLLSDRDGMGSL